MLGHSKNPFINFAKQITVIIENKLKIWLVMNELKNNTTQVGKQKKTANNYLELN